MTERVNLVDAYDNRSVIAKMVSMEERISGAEDSIEKTVKDGQTSIDSKVTNGVTQINTLMSDLKDIKAEATAAASTAETATATANGAVTKAESASATIAADITTSVNAAADAKGYATTGVLHDGTAVNSAEYFQKLTQTAADQASASASSASASAASAIQTAAQAASSEINAKTSESNAAASATAAAESAAGVDKSNFVQVLGGVQQVITGEKIFSDGIKVPNRETEATDNDVINFHDINSSSGPFNNLVHRTGAQTITGETALTSAVICMAAKKVHYNQSRLHAFDTMMKSAGSPLYFSLIFATAESEIKIFLLHLSGVRDTDTGEWTITPSIRGSSIGTYSDNYASTKLITIGVRYPKYVEESGTNAIELYFAHSGDSYNQHVSVTVLAAEAHGGSELPLTFISEVVSVPKNDDSSYKYTEVTLS